MSVLKSLVNDVVCSPRPEDRGPIPYWGSIELPPLDQMVAAANAETDLRRSVFAFRGRGGSTANFLYSGA